MTSLGQGKDKAPEKATRPPAATAEVKRPPRSGEGARSALEQLLREERTRRAQRPREEPPQDAGE